MRARVRAEERAAHRAAHCAREELDPQRRGFARDRGPVHRIPDRPVDREPRTPVRALGRKKGQ